jgi:phosphoenolpyruvate-protein phosphotransferase/dihydroxyacetone kinase phosphotransfer subunit
MVGIVVVSHSPSLATAAVDLALEMVAQSPPRIVIAAGTSEGLTGTDAVRVAEAIVEADRGDGVVVITDLGSAVLSSELALEFLPEPAPQVRIVAAPFVEGLLAATVRAAGGADLDEVAREATGALGAKSAQLSGTPTARPTSDKTAPAGAPDATAEARLANPSGLHARPAAQLAAAAAAFDADIRVATKESVPVPAVSPTALASLGARSGDTIIITAYGADAAAAVKALVALVAGNFGEGGAMPAAADQPAVTAQPNHGTGQQGRPLGVSPGRVVGVAARMPEPITEPNPALRIDPSSHQDAVERLHAASEQVAATLRERASRLTPPISDVLVATASMASDPVVIGEAADAIQQDGSTPESAVWSSYGRIAEAFRGAGGLQAERANDVLDVRSRIVAELTGQAPPGIPAPPHPFVLVANDLAPADTAELDPESCLAIVTAEGGPTSHTAILARSLGIPAVVGACDALLIHDGDLVLVDGSTGEVVIAPTPEQAATAMSSRAEKLAFTGPGSTADGHLVPILANLGGPGDVAKATDAGAEGVGLFRTEFCFLDRVDAPDIDEQVSLYSSVLSGFPGRKVVVRTLDAGSDKPLPFLTPHAEANPALGVRGYRTALAHPEVLDDQLRAIAMAADAVPDTEAWVMAPMISTVDEASAFAARARNAGLSTVGIMVETPAAALLAHEMLEHIDFVSIGTNDLAQYTLAADRLGGPVASMNDPWQPAVLRLIDLVGRAGAATGKPVGVCGEAAADPLLACVLVGLGITSLSMTARAIPAVGSAVGAVRLVACQRAARAAVAADTPDNARRAARAALADN